VVARVDAFLGGHSSDLVAGGEHLFCMATAASRPWLAASFESGVRKVWGHQPPLRPEAPKPAISFSTMAMRR